jgi:ESS family glutamate:Na+ symporter
MKGYGDAGSFLINVIFAGVFIGTELPSPKQVLDEGGPQTVYGLMMTMNQYVFGLGGGLALAKMGMDVPDYFGIILPGGFEGGHGTAAAIKGNFIAMGWGEGVDLTLMSATFGLVGGVLSGIISLNIIRGMGWLKSTDSGTDDSEHSPEDLAMVARGIYPIGMRMPAAYQTTTAEAMDTMSLQAAILLFALFIGYVFKRSSILLEGSVEFLASAGILSSIPLFTFCMIAGFLVNMVMQKIGLFFLIDRSSLDRISGMGLDVLVTCAISSMDVAGALDKIVPFLIIACTGIAVNLFGLFCLYCEWNLKICQILRVIEVSLRYRGASRLC